LRPCFIAGKIKNNAAFIFTLLFLSCNPDVLANQNELDSLLSVLNKPGNNDSVKANILLRLSYSYQQSDPVKSENCAFQALALAESFPNSDLLMYALSRAGSVYMQQRKTAAAFNVYYRQLSLATANKNLNSLQSAYLGIASVYEEENDWQKALSYTLKAILVAEQTGSPGEIAFAYRFLSKEYLMTGDDIKAERYIREAIKKCDRSVDHAGLGDCMLNLGDIYVIRKKYAAAKSYYDSSLHFFMKAEKISQAAKVYLNLGQMYTRQSDFRNAKICCNKAIALLNKDSASLSEYATAYLCLGIIDLNEKKFDSASEILHSGFAQLQKDNIVDLQLKYLLYMTTADSALGNYRESMMHLQQYRELYSQYYNEATARATQRVLTEFDMQNKDKENLELKQQTAVQNEKINILIVLGMAVLIAAIILALQYRQKNAALRSLKDLQHSAEEKNKELTTLNNVKDKLISMIIHDIRSPLTSLLSSMYATRSNILEVGEFNEMSKSLEDDVRHLLTMLDNTLLWARNQIQAIEIEKTSFNLYDLTEEVIGLYHKSAEKKSLTITNSIKPGTEVFTDREIIHTVLRNLLSNAIKFTPAGKNIFITEQCENEKLLITIADEGTGISKEVMNKIISKKLISTRGTGNEKGTGLGLLFSTDLLTRLNEMISINSSKNNGTAVTFSINKAA